MKESNNKKETEENIEENKEKNNFDGCCGSFSSGFLWSEEM